MIYPLVQEIPFADPITVFARFAGKPGSIFLESAHSPQQGSGRYSFIAVDPIATLASKNGEVQWNGTHVYVDPFQFLQQLLTQLLLEKIPELPPFQGGVAGFFGYDLYQHLEAVPRVEDEMQFPDLVLGFYDVVIAFDHEKKRAWIFSCGFSADSFTVNLEKALARQQWLLAEIQQHFQLKSIPEVTCRSAAIVSNFTADTYQDAVKKVIEYILEGDIFEANISQCFKTELPEGLSPFDLYRRLRAINPAPFAAFLMFEDVVLVSASPERFLQLSDKKIETRPIKGTRARGETVTEDERLKQDLVSSEKDRSENVMIVDLLRNDLSRVCRGHSVKVPQLCGLETYASVHHLVSVVTGELSEEKDAIDLLRASFPGGSITGAPKVRAMEIIAEVEALQRGPYCGSIGYIGFNGDMDTSIIIRTFAIKNRVVAFQAGGAVVADSDPLAEYKETLTKAKALHRALTESVIA